MLLDCGYFMMSRFGLYRFPTTYEREVLNRGGRNVDIGGKDLFEMGKPLTKNEVAKVVWRFWPDLVIENCDMNDREEFFIYENPASKALWDIDCADGEAAMLYIMFDPDCLSIVVDSDGSDDHVAEAVFQAMREKNNV